MSMVYVRAISDVPDTAHVEGFQDETDVRDVVAP